MTDDEVERILRALDTNDVEAVVSLFAEDATFESPAIPHVLNRKEGVCRGRDEIRELVRAMMQRPRPWGKHKPPLVRGNTVVIEYMSASSDTEPFSVDIIEFENGKIRSFRAYAGWRARFGDG